MVSSYEHIGVCEVCHFQQVGQVGTVDISPKGVVGSMQRLLATAQNGLEVIRFGGLAHDVESSPFEVVERFEFRKEVGPKKLGVRLAGDSSSSATVTIEDW